MCPTSCLPNLDAYQKRIGGVFKLELFLPDDYPMTPPKIRFLTKIYHPNVDKLGRICLDVLKSESKSQQWPRLERTATDRTPTIQTTGHQLCRFALSCFPFKLSWVPPTPMIRSPPMLPRRGKRTRPRPSPRPGSGHRSTPFPSNFH